MQQAQTYKPSIVAFEITQRCPLNCLHCRACATRQGTDPLSTGQCRRVLQSIADFTHCIVIFTGGEPMTRPDIYELVSFAAGAGLRPVLATCGVGVDDNCLLKLKEAGLLLLSFSLDGATGATHDSFRQSPGAFDAVILAAAKAQKAGLKFQINTTVTKENADDIEKIAVLAEKIGAVCFNPFVLVPIGRGRDIKDMMMAPAEYEKFLHRLVRIKTESRIELRVTCGPQYARVARQEKIASAEKVSGCLAATGFAFISAQGDVRTCGFLDISAGNLVANGFDFADIWLNSQYLKDLRVHENYKGSCRTCAYLNCCRGCRARAYALTGDYFSADSACILVDRKHCKDSG